MFSIKMAAKFPFTLFFLFLLAALSILSALKRLLRLPPPIILFVLTRFILHPLPPFTMWRRAISVAGATLTPNTMIAPDKKKPFCSSLCIIPARLIKQAQNEKIRLYSR